MFALMPWTKRTTAPLPRAETPFRWLPEEFENLFNRFLTSWPVLETPEWPYRWGLTMEEKEKEVVVRVELPGFTPEEIKVELLGERLLVEAEHKEPVEKKEKEETKEERTYAHVKRELTLPPEVEMEKAEASYRNGVLEVHLPRKPEAAGRRIEVKT
jgi:HSP20 family protein